MDRSKPAEPCRHPTLIAEILINHRVRSWFDGTEDKKFTIISRLERRHRLTRKETLVRIVLYRCGREAKSRRTFFRWRCDRGAVLFDFRSCERRLRGKRRSFGLPSLQSSRFELLQRSTDTNTATARTTMSAPYAKVVGTEETLKVTPDLREQEATRPTNSSSCREQHPNDDAHHQFLHRRASSSSSDADNNHNKKRRICFSEKCSAADKNDDKELPATQPCYFSQAVYSADEDDDAPKDSVVVQDAGNDKISTLLPACCCKDDDYIDIYTIGREPTSSLVCKDSRIGRHHADIFHNRRLGSFRLRAYNDCLLLHENKWEKVAADSSALMDEGWSFRLVPKSKHDCRNAAPETGVEFCLGLFEANQQARKAVSGSASMDTEYLNLLRLIQKNGYQQKNKKGSNHTLRDQVTLEINLSNPCDKDLLPITTLRKIFPVAAILEAVWYLRGENHIKFLQRHNQRFWDKQARDNGWLGYNYGLLTRYDRSSSSATAERSCGGGGNPQQDYHYQTPQQTTSSPINQVEESVLKPLCQGKSSRNMVCTLCKPGEATVQQACTSSVQFTVSSLSGEGGDEMLDLTVTQRSSDVILGLPHDVIVWSVLLHLVRREVRLRAGRILRAGRLNFCISGGGAHVYDINANNMQELLTRAPVPNVQPFLVVDKSCQTQGMMDLARSFGDDGMVKLRAADYTQGCYHPLMKIEQAVEDTHKGAAADRP